MKEWQPCWLYYLTGVHATSKRLGHLDLFLFQFCNLSDVQELPWGMWVDQGTINYIDTKAKCRHLKKLTCKGTLRQVFYQSL
jgi:hypothetical protein